MLLRGAVLALLTLATAQALPRTEVIVEAAVRYVAQYQRDFTYLVADEDCLQRVVAGGVELRVRRTRGELFSTFVDQARTWISVRDVADVDGVAVPDRDNVRALLTRESVASLAPRIAASNARFNIGHVSRNFNEPTLALLLFAPTRRPDVAFDRGPSERTPDGDSLMALRLRGRDGLAFVRGLNGRVSVRGTAVVEPQSGRVHRTTLTIEDGQVEAVLETTYAFDSHVQLWVPVMFDERYTARRDDEATLVHTTLGNYRRYETGGRLVQ